MNFALRIYRRLAQAFPHEFKLAYGDEVTQVGEDVVQEIAKRHGAAGSGERQTVGDARETCVLLLH